MSASSTLSTAIRIAHRAVALPSEKYVATFSPEGLKHAASNIASHTFARGPAAFRSMKSTMETTIASVQNVKNVSCMKYREIYTIPGESARKSVAERLPIRPR